MIGILRDLLGCVMWRSRFYYDSSYAYADRFNKHYGNIAFLKVLMST